MAPPGAQQANSRFPGCSRPCKEDPRNADVKGRVLRISRLLMPVVRNALASYVQEDGVRAGADRDGRRGVAK